MREAIKALSTDIGFYDDFSRYANGYALGNATTTPLVGPTYRQHWNGDAAASMVIENKALRAPVNTNNELSSAVAPPNGELDMTFMMETRSPSGFYNTNENGFTITFKESEILNPDGSGLFGLVGSIHININPSGVTDCQMWGSGSLPLVSPDARFMPTGVAAGGGGMRWNVRVRAIGNTLEITAFGKTLRWESALIAGRLAAATTHFYFQIGNTPFAGSPAPAERNYSVCHKMWANAPSLNLDAAIAGDGSSRMLGHANVVWPNLFAVAPGDRPLVGHDKTAIAATNPVFVARGATAANAATSRYEGPGSYFEGPVLMTWPCMYENAALPVLSRRTPLTAKVQSPANAVVTTGWRGLFKLNNLPPGMVEKTELVFTLGANSNSKQVAVRLGTVQRFTSGATTESGGIATLSITRQSLTGMSDLFVFEWWSAGLGHVKGTYEQNLGTTYAAFDLAVAGTALGDVTLISERTTVTQ